MKKAYLKALSLCLLLIFCIGAATATEERTMQVPCLTVRGGTEGNISHQPFTFSIGHSDRPLRILIGDDTPGGSGNEIRNSVWLAATTAALQRKISLQGVKIEVEFSGSVDGPSAGAVFCLAIMSAIDGRQFPSDFAMTGTIMPDGTVGAVGGIPAKIRAAAKQGKKRFCIPAVYRFEIFNGEVVDLFRLGKELGVEIFPVDNINEAYCYMHKLPQPVKPNLNARDLCRLNEKTEDVILEQCYLLDKQTDEFAKKLPAYMQEILNNLFPENTIEDLLKQGAFLPLYEFLSEHYSGAKSYVAFNTFWEETLKRYPILMKEKLNAEDLPKYRDALFSFYQELAKGQSESEQKTANQAEKDAEEKSPQNTPLVLAQMYPMDTFCELWTPFMDMPQWTDRKDLDSLSAEELIAAKKLFIEMWVNQSILGILLEDDLLAKSREQVVLTMPPMKENKSVKAVENLLYQSTRSTLHALNSVLDDIEKNLDSTEPGKMFAFSIWGAEKSHMNLKKDEVIISILFQIEAFTRGQALLIKYGPDLGMQCNDDGSFSYRNTAFLSYLIRTARENALLRIAECKAQSVPCLAAIKYFQQAELLRDAVGVDKLHDVLEIYWRASLLAEALQMCFQK